MSDAVLVALIPAVGAIVVALVALLRQLLTQRARDRAAATERQLATNGELLGEYRMLIAEHRADAQDARTETDRVRLELIAEREAHRQTRIDRDRWRYDAEQVREKDE